MDAVLSDAPAEAVTAPAGSGSSLLQQLRHAAARMPGLTATGTAAVRAWREVSDYHNNYGCEFIPTRLLSSEYRESVALLVAPNAPVHSMQSGPSADERTFANVAWDDAVSSCAQLFHGMHLLVCTTARVGPPPVRAGVAFAECGPQGLERRDADCVLPVALLHDGLHAAHAGAVQRHHLQLPLDQGRCDAAYRAQRRLQLQQAFRAQRSICLIEPLCIPGMGRCFRPSFMRAVQALCDELRVPLVADETLSAVRCGAPLLSCEHGLRPAYVMLGKAFGCGVLLSALDYRADLARTTSVLGSGHQILLLAFVLRYVRDHGVVEHCRKEGPLLGQTLESVVGVGNVRQVGMVLWVDNHIERLPIAAAVHGRLLPRIDQSAAELRRHIDSQQSRMQFIRSLGAAAVREAKLFSCAICSLQDGDLLECDGCLRVYHQACKKRIFRCACQH
jgi:hypothetical protein